MYKSKLNIWRPLREVFIRRKYKDFLIRRVFQDKKDLLDLYNALNGSHYDNPDDLEITTLEDAIYMSCKNDISFILSSTLNLYEHQSTINPNMPLRCLLYVSRVLEAYVKMNRFDIYGKKLIPLPCPQFVVLYNGKDKIPDESFINLSDSYMTSDHIFDTMLECKVRVLNINYGHNEDILNTCTRLHDYSIFISKVNGYIDEGCTQREAIDAAIEYCISNDILRDILEKSRSEVYDMLLTEYDEKLHLKTVHEEGYEAGYNIGQSDGYNQGQSDGKLSEIYSSVQDGDYSIARGSEKAGVTVAEFKSNMTKAGYKLPTD